MTVKFFLWDSLGNAHLALFTDLCNKTFVKKVVGAVGVVGIVEAVDVNSVDGAVVVVGSSVCIGTCC